MHVSTRTCSVMFYGNFVGYNCNLVAKVLGPCVLCVCVCVVGTLSNMELGIVPCFS